MHFPGVIPIAIFLHMYMYLRLACGQGEADFDPSPASGGPGRRASSGPGSPPVPDPSTTLWTLPPILRQSPGLRVLKVAERLDLNISVNPTPDPPTEDHIVDELTDELYGRAGETCVVRRLFHEFLQLETAWDEEVWWAVVRDTVVKQRIDEAKGCGGVDVRTIAMADDEDVVVCRFPAPLRRRRRRWI